MDASAEAPASTEEDAKINTDDLAESQASEKGAAPESDPPKDGSKHYRKRKRHHFNAIRSQMEFYFGDANLTKDRFLKQLIDKEPFVPLETFLTFNKMKVLTSSTEEIAKSLSNSQLLELDDAHQKVRRKTALPVERNVDENTLYVEALPVTADHDWVRQAFERFGAIAYISLPKYAKSRKIKEFGFIEFEQKSSVDKAIKAFKDFNGVLSMQEADPAELKSIKAFIKEQNNEEDAKVKEEKQEEEETLRKAGKKRRKAVKAEEAESAEPKPKKIKTDDNSAATGKDAADTTASETAGETTNDEGGVQSQEEVAADGSAKKKHRKKKKKTAEKRRKEIELNTDASFYELKILPKRDWKRLRNKYLNLQREKIAELKRKAWRERQQLAAQQAKESTAAEKLDAAAPTPAKKTKPNERKLRKMNMNFYGAGGVEDEPKVNVRDVKQNPALERTPLFSYAPGLIVEVTLLEPCVNVKDFKADMRQYTAVKYVDVKEGAMQAQLRLESADAAEDFVRQVSCAEYKCKALAGEAETEYWRKIEQDREMKLNKQVKVPQKRGREKVKKLVTKHIRFGDDE